MGLKEHCWHLLNEAIHKEFEEIGENEVPYNYEIPVPISTCDLILKLIDSQEIKEPLEDVVFFVGKATKESVVYHVLCRKVTLDAMRKDNNIHFMMLKQFSGVMENDTGIKTLDEQENENRAILTGGSHE